MSSGKRVPTKRVTEPTDTDIMFNPEASGNEAVLRRVFGDNGEVLNEGPGQDRGLLRGLEHAFHCKVQSLSSAYSQYRAADAKPAVLSALKLMID